jgi:3-methyladenine DNA glycosylase/8-oxoguanine DNA glycosylase
MADQAIIERLTEVRGIGPWTVQMLLIFYLGRPDVLPVGDLGVRKGYQQLRGFQILPDPDKLERAGRRWRPYRSVATWYLWRALDIVLPTD